MELRTGVFDALKVKGKALENKKKIIIITLELLTLVPE